MSEPKNSGQYKVPHEKGVKTIFRIAKNKGNPFVMIDRRKLENQNISWSAKGLLAYLLSRPDDWIINMWDLVKRSTDKEYSTRSALKELIAAGHVKYMGRERDKGQVKRAVWQVHEEPVLPDSENQHQVPPDRDFPNLVFPNQGNLPLNNIDSTETNGNNTNIRGAGIDWKLGHAQPIEDMDEETQFLYLARDAANLIATGRPIRYEYAMNYMLSTRTIPTEKQIKHWRKTVDEWLDIKPACPSPADISTGVGEHIAKELSFGGPHSFTYLFQKGKNNGHDAKGNQKSTDSRQGRQAVDSYSAADLAAADRINKRANGG